MISNLNLRLWHWATVYEFRAFPCLHFVSNSKFAIGFHAFANLSPAFRPWKAIPEAGPTLRRPYRPIFASKTTFCRPFRPIFTSKTSSQRPYRHIFASKSTCWQAYWPISTKDHILIEIVFKILDFTCMAGEPSSSQSCGGSTLVFNKIMAYWRLIASRSILVWSNHGLLRR